MTVELALRYQRQWLSLRQRLARQMRSVWSLAGLSDPQLAAWLAVAVPLVDAAQIAAGQLVTGYLAASLRQAGLVERLPAPSRQEMSTDQLRGVTTGALLTRPIIQARTDVSQGIAAVQALTAARHRAEAIADTSTALAQRAATVRAASRPNPIVGYRRVLTGESCGLCGTASRDSYRTDELAPIHARCDCSVAPIIGNDDPARQINRRHVDRLINQPADQATGRRLQVDGDQVALPAVEVRRHGELGPVLVDPAHEFTSTR